MRSIWLPREVRYEKGLDAGKEFWGCSEYPRC